LFLGDVAGIESMGFIDAALGSGDALAADKLLSSKLCAVDGSMDRALGATPD
jgi:hypothetical protein